MTESHFTVDCREDPCGYCRYCRFDPDPREAELPVDHLVRWLDPND